MYGHVVYGTSLRAEKRHMSLKQVPKNVTLQVCETIGLSGEEAAAWSAMVTFFVTDPWHTVCHVNGSVHLASCLPACDVGTTDALTLCTDGDGHRALS